MSPHMYTPWDIKKENQNQIWGELDYAAGGRIWQKDCA